jgi:uncharacterized protein YlbG (UPF0298 family)
MTLLQIITSLSDTLLKDTTIHNTLHFSTKPINIQETTNSSIDSNILAAIIGALATLLCTVFWERIKEAIDARKERRKKLVYFASLVKPIVVYSEKQATDIKDFSDAIHANPLEFPILKYSPKNAIEKIVNKIEEEPFFNAFTTFYKPYLKSVRNFKSITSLIEYQNLQLDQVLEMVKTSQQFDHERKIKFKEYFGAVTELAANSIANQSLHQYPDFIALLDKCLVNYLTHRPSPSDLKFAYEAFVEPVKFGIVENKFYEIPVGLEIANNLQNATFVYHDILMQMNSLKEDIATIAESYKNSNDKLKTESEPFLNDFF